MSGEKELPVLMVTVASYIIILLEHAQEYKVNFDKAVNDLRKLHSEQLQRASKELSAKLTKPRPSREYLNLKKMEVWTG